MNSTGVVGRAVDEDDVAISKKVGKIRNEREKAWSSLKRASRSHKIGSLLAPFRHCAHAKPWLSRAILIEIGPGEPGLVKIT